ncbi:MAG: hypothetical protein K8F25_17040 [Fimbriimonadaceae bacterium]|nr:hypothetical protein [Alphaproteobacteria bacterium]
MTGTINDTMEAVAHASFSVVVDSSKTAYRDFHRPLLYRINGYRVILVHLKRPLKGVLSSAMKGTNKDLEAGNNKLRAFNQTRTILGYTFAHSAAAINRLICKEFIRVEHGEMLEDISRVVDAILAPADAAIGRSKEEKTAHRAAHGMHEIAGNRLLRGNSHE